MAYRGKYRPKNFKKYKGDSTKIVYRSLWERNAFRWLDENPQIIKWSSEEVVIPYICGTDNKPHRYFMDLYFETSTGEKFIIEIKPKKETIAPKKPKSGRQTKRYISESLTYIKNDAKWNAAQEYASDRGWKFAIWTEDTLRSLGIKII